MERIKTLIRKENYTGNAAESVFKAIFEQVKEKIEEVVAKMNIFFKHNVKKFEEEEDLIEDAVLLFLDLEC